MSTTTEIEAAVDELDAIDAVRMVDVTHTDGGTPKLTVSVAAGVDSTAPLTDVLAAFELRIWYADFDLGAVILVPESELTYPDLDGGGAQ